MLRQQWIVCLWIRPANVAGILSELKRCSRLRDVETGRKIHGLVVELGLFSNLYLANALISMYSKCSSIVSARNVFDSMSQLDVVSWNTLLQGYVENGEVLTALALFFHMHEESVCFPDARTYLSIVSAYTSLVSKSDLWSRDWLEVCRAVHARAETSRCCDAFVYNALINLYSKCRSMVEARSVFEKMDRRDVVSWNTLLQGYVDNGENKLALELFEEMESGVSADARTFLVALKASAAAASEETCTADRNKWLQAGKSIHTRALKTGNSDIYIESALVDLYGRCGDLTGAKETFERMKQKNVVSWTALIQGYVDNGEYETALELFDTMGCSPNPRTFLVALGACTSLAAKRDGKVTRWLERGKDLHSRAVSTHCCDIHVENTLVNFYSKCGNLVNARAVFEKLSPRNTGSWNSIILGYVENGFNKEALDLLKKMKSAGFRQDSLTYTAALLACGNLMALERGKEFHAEIERCGGEEDVAAKLVEFYGKCGSFNAAKFVFESLVWKCDDTRAWNALLCGYSHGGKSEQVLGVFKEMREQGVCPDEFTFTYILASCCHGGLRDEGREWFGVMLKEHGIKPDVFHYTCMADLLARGDKLEEAVEVIKSMPFQGSRVTWFVILAACGRQGEFTEAKMARQALLDVDEDASASYVLLANMLQ